MCLSLAISPSLLEALQNSQEWGFFVTDVLILTRNRSDLNIGSAPHLKPQCLPAKESFDSVFQFIITSSPSLPPFLLFLRLSLFFPSHLTSSFFSLLLCFFVPLFFSPFFLLLSSPFLSRLIQSSASDQLFYIVTKCNTNSAINISFISLLFSALDVSSYEWIGVLAS